MVILICVMLLAGIFGGMINYFLTRKTVGEDRSILKSVTVGIGASFLVSLFLNMISSNLLDSITGTEAAPGYDSKVLVFAGFCLIAAISSSAFIRTLSDRVLNEAKEARKQAEQANQKAEKAEERASEVQAVIEPIVDKETEKEPAAERPPLSAPPEGLEEKHRRVLDAFVRSSYALRTMSGVAKDAGIDDVAVCEAILSDLAAKDLVGKRMGRHGIRWYITQKSLDALTFSYQGIKADRFVLAG